MACFTVPLAEAIAVTAAAQIVKAKEKKTVKPGENGSVSSDKIPMGKKLMWLAGLLFGGSVLLAFEHLWHGEIVPYYPFLTAMSDPVDKAQMLHEMATVGVAMAVAVTVVWAGVCIAASAIVKRKPDDTVQQGSQA